MKKYKNKGFTLIELLVVIVILALLIIITSVSIFNVLNKIHGNIEVQNAKLLIKQVNEYLMSENILSSNENLAGIYIIDDNKGYVLNSEGIRERFESFDNSNKLCDYCIVKINDDNKINLLMEGKEQNIIKDYNSEEIKVEKLKVSREEDSLFNELDLFANIYMSNNVITSRERFIVENDKIYKVNADGTKNNVAILNNSKSLNESKLDITSDLKYNIEITTKDNVIFTNNSTSNLIEKDEINSEYSTEVLKLYEEIKYIVEIYTQNNNITKEIYIEFNNGTMNIVDEYGNYTKKIVMNQSIEGSGELKINTSKQFAVTIYKDTYDIKNDYGSLKLYDKDLKYSRDMTILVKNLDRLENLAKKYTNSTSTSSTYNGFYKKTWLVPFYIRRLKYNSDYYNIVTGKDSNFVTYVANNAANLKTYFTNKNDFSVNGQSIDLKHMMASLAGNIYNTDSLYNLLYEELEYDCLVSWAGDLHEFMEYNILKNNVKTQYGNFGKATYQLLGNSSTKFSLDDIYADVDNWNIYYNLKNNKNLTIAQAFDQYYSKTSSRNYKNRFKSFVTIMNSVGSSLGKTNFSGLVNHFTNMDKSWETIGTLSVMPTEDEEKQIATNFINWINEKANNEN